MFYENAKLKRIRNHGERGLFFLPVILIVILENATEDRLDVSEIHFLPDHKSQMFEETFSDINSNLMKQAMCLK